MQQVDDFAIPAPDAKTSDTFMDMIDDRLKIPIKHQGYLDMYNGVDVHQTRYYISKSIWRRMSTKSSNPTLLPG